MSIPKIKLFGDRIAIVEINEKIEGELVIPQNAKLGSYELGRVEEVSDKVTSVKKGDIVLFQIPNLVKNSVVYRFDKDSKIAVIHQGDVIGRLKAPSVSMDNFEIAGNWLLFEIDIRQPNAGILLPDSVKPQLEDIHWKLLQKGNSCDDVDCKIGQSALIERTRANPIQIGSTEYAFISKEYLYGTVE